jgi:hypothetical protein
LMNRFWTIRQEWTMLGHLMMRKGLSRY